MLASWLFIAMCESNNKVFTNWTPNQIANKPNGKSLKKFQFCKNTHISITTTLTYLVDFLS
jgi:hypothetical protein